MTMHIAEEELMAYLDGELSRAESEGAAAHLEHCRECQALAADFQRVSRRLMEWQIEPSNVQVAWEPRKTPDAPKSMWRSRLFRLGWVLAPITALVVIGFLASPPLSKRQLEQVTRTTALGEMSTAAQAPSVTLGHANNPLIVHTAQLTLSTSNFDKARPSLDDILKRHRGYFGQLNASSPSGAGRTLDVTLRVPAAELDAVIAELKKLGRVESESRTGSEVTQQSIDLEARYANARNTEARLTELLRQRAGKLTDVLAVEKEIDRVREEIERLEAERKSLASRVEFASLVLKVFENYKAQLNIAPDSTATRFRNAAVEGYQSMADGIVGLALALLSYGPAMLLWAGLLFFPARFLWRRYRRT